DVVGGAARCHRAAGTEADPRIAAALPQVAGKGGVGDGERAERRDVAAVDAAAGSFADAVRSGIIAADRRVVGEVPLVDGERALVLDAASAALRVAGVGHVVHTDGLIGLERAVGDRGGRVLLIPETAAQSSHGLVVGQCAFAEGEHAVVQGTVAGGVVI